LKVISDAKPDAPVVSYASLDGAVIVLMFNFKPHTAKTFQEYALEIFILL